MQPRLTIYIAILRPGLRGSLPGARCAAEVQLHSKSFMPSLRSAATWIASESGVAFRIRVTFQRGLEKLS
jgi:hypothetical protein